MQMYTSQQNALEKEKDTFQNQIDESVIHYVSSANRKVRKEPFSFVRLPIESEDYLKL